MSRFIPQTAGSGLCGLPIPVFYLTISLIYMTYELSGEVFISLEIANPVYKTSQEIIFSKLYTEKCQRMSWHKTRL